MVSLEPLSLRFASPGLRRLLPGSHSASLVRYLHRRSVLTLDVLGLDEDHISTLAEHRLSSFLEQDSTSQQRRFVHATLIGITVNGDGPRVEVGDVGVDRFQEVRVWKSLILSSIEVSVSPVEVVFFVAIWGASFAEEHLVWVHGNVGEVVSVSDRLVLSFGLRFGS